MVELLQIETAFLPTNGEKFQEAEHVLFVDFNLHYEEIFVDSATKKMDKGIMHVVLAWIVRYLAASHCLTQLKLDG